MARQLFILSRDKERQAIDGATFEPHKRELLYQMVDAVWNIRNTGQVTEADLAPIRKGFTLPEESVWGRAGGWLAKLVDFAPELTKVVDELAAHADEHVRARLCASLTDNHYQEVFVLPRLRRFLADRSQVVREAAVRVCLKRQSTKLVPALEAARAAETDEKLRQRFDMAVALIRGEPYWLTDERE